MKKHVIRALFALIPAALIAASPAPSGKGGQMQALIQSASDQALVATLNATGTDGGIHSMLSNQSFAGKNLTGLYFTNQLAEWSDFTNCTGITGADLSNAICLMGSTLTGVDLTGLVIPAKIGTAMSFVGTNVTVAQLNQCTNLTYSNLSGLDLTGFVVPNKSAAYINFTGCTHLTTAQLSACTNLTGCVLVNTGITQAALTTALNAAWTGTQASKISSTISSIKFQ